MHKPLTGEAGAIRQVIQQFIAERLQTKLDGLKPDDDAKRLALHAEHDFETWVADAARRVGQIQLATHTLKPIHPDARGSSLHAFPDRVTPGLVGTHSLAQGRPSDVVGNAAALDVYKFLSLQYQGRSLMQLVLVDNPAFRAALSDDADKAQTWQQAFAAITETKTPFASHSLAKQLYFPLPDGGYHLLAPLFPTSLAHCVHQTMREDRFGDEAKAARDARRKNLPWHKGFREYPNLGIRKFGGTKPQNISQLNSERYGENWLLPSVPPVWKQMLVRPPLNTDSVFAGSFSRGVRIRELTRTLRLFLANTQHNNMRIRQTRSNLLASICDEAIHFAARLGQLSAGWSVDPACRLHAAEVLWLDPVRRQDELFMSFFGTRDWQLEVSQRFANWLNQAIGSTSIVLGEAEHQQWTADLLRELRMFREELDNEHD